MKISEAGGWSIRSLGTPNSFLPAIGVFDREVSKQQWTKGREKIALDIFPTNFQITRWETEYDH